MGPAWCGPRKSIHPYVASTAWLCILQVGFVCQPVHTDVSVRRIEGRAGAARLRGSAYGILIRCFHEEVSASVRTDSQSREIADKTIAVPKFFQQTVQKIDTQPARKRPRGSLKVK